MSDFINVLLYKDIRDERNTVNGHFFSLFACFIPDQGYLGKVSAVWIWKVGVKDGGREGSCNSAFLFV